MKQLLEGEALVEFVQGSIGSMLGAVGERSVARELVQLLSDERLDVFVRRRIADALGKLAEESVTGELVQMLANERLDVDLRKSIADALAAYASEISIVEGLIMSLQDQQISDSVYNALWTISRRAGVWIFPKEVEVWPKVDGVKASNWVITA